MWTDLDVNGIRTRAQMRAVGLESEAVLPGHILLTLCEEVDSAAAALFHHAGIDQEALSLRINRMIRRSEQVHCARELLVSAEAERILEELSGSVFRTELSIDAATEVFIGIFLRDDMCRHAFMDAGVSVERLLASQMWMTEYRADILCQYFPIAHGAKSAIMASSRIASHVGSSGIEPVHLFLALCLERHGIVEQTLDELGLNVNEISSKIYCAISEEHCGGNVEAIKPSMSTMLALRRARDFDEGNGIDREHLMWALLMADDVLSVFPDTAIAKIRALLPQPNANTRAQRDYGVDDDGEEQAFMYFNCCDARVRLFVDESSAEYTVACPKCGVRVPIKRQPLS